MNIDLIIRISAFVGIFAAMAVWEWMAPRRQWQTAKAKRWVINLAMVGFNTLFTRTLLASGALGAAVLAGQRGVGLFHQLDWPWWAELIIAMIVLDPSMAVWGDPCIGDLRSYLAWCSSRSPTCLTFPREWVPLDSRWWVCLCAGSRSPLPSNDAMTAAGPAGLGSSRLFPLSAPFGS